MSLAKDCFRFYPFPTLLENSVSQVLEEAKNFNTCLCKRQSLSNTMNISNKLGNFNEPFIVDGLLDWEMLKWDIDKWNSVLKDEELEFRMGSSKFTEEPQWENTCERLQGTFQDFLDFSGRNDDSWLYFDYKYLKDTFVQASEIRDNIKWDKFGLVGKNCDDSVIWIGNKGAHTPCHLDTYGCNYVAQIFGRKLWLLFPPDQNLQSTRIPYEESSVYSKLNLYSPKGPEEYKDISGCRTTVLHPGQVLFIPKGWWHYVENLEIAISINIWMPLTSDHEKRIEEAITLSLISSVMSSMEKEESRKILNSANIELPSPRESLKYINQSIEKYKEFKKKSTTKLDTDAEMEFDTGQYATKLKELKVDEFAALIRKQSQRFAVIEESRSEKAQFNGIISAFTDPEVIELIKQKLLKE